MAKEVLREEVRELVGGGAAVVEVLPADEYEHEHIQGAINIPLRNLDREAPERLRRNEPVIVYCNDYQ